jgi:hypothetical protein
LPSSSFSRNKFFRLNKVIVFFINLWIILLHIQVNFYWEILQNNLWTKVWFRMKDDSISSWSIKEQIWSVGKEFQPLLIMSLE